MTHPLTTLSVPVGLVLLLLCTAAPRPANADARRGRMWASATRGVGQLVDGNLTGAVASFGAARQARALPVLDALVGLAALQGGGAAAARRQLDAAIKRGSTEPMVLYWAGRAALKAGDRAGALARVEQALAVGGDRPVLRVAHALLLDSLGKRAAAAASLLKAAAREPNLLAPSLYPTPAQGAVDLLGIVLRGFPSREQVLRTQGHLLWRCHRPLAALGKFSALLKRRPRDADAMQMSARCLAALGKKRRALTLAGRAVEQAPDMGHVRAARGELLLARGKPRLAMADLRRAADALPRDGRLLTLLGQACSRSEKPDDARKYFSYAIRRNGSDAEAHFGLGLLLQQAGKHKEAATLLGRALILSPGSSRYYKGAAHLASVRGERKLAVKLLAAARATAAVEKKLRRQVRRAEKAMSLQVRALDAAAEGKACTRACRFAVSRAPTAARRFLQAHLALTSNKQPMKAVFLTPTLARMKLDALLGRDPTVLMVKGKVRGGQAYELRKILPMVPIH